LFIMSSFSHIENGLLFKHIKWPCSRSSVINQFDDKFNSTLNSIHCSIHFTISIEMEQLPTSSALKTILFHHVIFPTRHGDTLSTDFILCIQKPTLNTNHILLA
jgi:hypothetical protein